MTTNPVRTGRVASIRPLTALGVSLIEALIAMAVMSFGMLAVVGVQTTLRLNADVAKQRSEATRIAEEEIERLRSFREIAAVAGASLGWDEVATLNGTVQTMVASNTEYTVDRVVTVPVGSAQKTLAVTVKWNDRYGNALQVVLRSVLAGAAPVLSALVTMPPSGSAAPAHKGRHPSIPPRAGDLGSGESAFKPSEGGTVAWTFNNVSGVITQVCTVTAASASGSLSITDLTTCTTTTAQLLAGVVRFNLRGVSKDFLDGTSVFKPIPGGTVAWVIDNSLKRIIRNCQVTAGSSTASLAAADVTGASCTSLGSPQALAPMDALNDPTYSLLALDSEDPRWPALPLNIALSLSSAGHSSAPLCFTDAPVTSVAANAQFAAEYFCIIYPNGPKTWSGTSTLSTAAFSDGGAGVWTVGVAASTYRVCRYTQANIATTGNADHPLAYADASGNLTNQNFLILYGTKACPTDVAANAASGDFVNSNTLQHQP